MIGAIAVFSGDAKARGWRWLTAAKLGLDTSTRRRACGRVERQLGEGLSAWKSPGGSEDDGMAVGRGHQPSLAAAS